MLTLSGDLGAGKTTFARALIRYLAGDETVEVPSPTFTLMQTYELPRFPLVHADFYRVSGSAELAELGFDDLPEGAVVVVEWPDRAAGFLPPTASTWRSRSRPSSSRSSATPASPATAPSRRASTASRRCASSSPRRA